MEKNKKRVFYDELDIFIWRHLFLAEKKKKESDHWKMAKEYCFEILNLNKEKDKKEIDKIYKKILSRLNSYCRFGFFDVCKNGDGKDFFRMNLNKITFIKHKFGRKEYECLLIRII